MMKKQPGIEYLYDNKIFQNMKTQQSYYNFINISMLNKKPLSGHVSAVANTDTIKMNKPARGFSFDKPAMESVPHTCTKNIDY